MTGKNTKKTGKTKKTISDQSDQSDQSDEADQDNRPVRPRRCEVKKEKPSSSDEPADEGKKYCPYCGKKLE